MKTLVLAIVLLMTGSAWAGTVYPYHVNVQAGACMLANGSSVLYAEQMIRGGCKVSSTLLEGDGIILDCRPVVGSGGAPYFAFATSRSACRVLLKRVGADE
jgi:hypothetical protein